MPEQRHMVLRRVVSFQQGLFRAALLTLLSFALSLAAAQSLKVGLGYLPDVQFAPFYLGVTQGLYEEEGLQVEFQHGFVTELYPLLSQNSLDFVVGDAEDVIALKAQENVPFRYLMALYQEVPNALFSLPESNITSIDDLVGKKVGIPGLFGTSYTSLQAMLEFAGLTEADIQLEQIGFTQVEAVLSGRVDVAMGFINNEPLILEGLGRESNVIAAGTFNRSAGNGVITNESVLEDKDLVERFIRATQKAMALTIAEPELAFEAAQGFVENLSDDRMAVLMTSIELYTSDFSDPLGIGFTDPAGWESTLELLKSTGRVDTELTADAFYTNDFLTLGISVE